MADCSSHAARAGTTRRWHGFARAAMAHDRGVPVLLRVLARLATVWALGALRRGAARRTPGTVPPWRTPGTGAAPDPAVVLRGQARRLVRAITEGLRILGHGLALAAFLSAFAVLLTAGTTSTSLGPRWVGIALLVLAAVALVAALGEFRIVWRLRIAQIRRRRADALRHQAP